MQVLPYNRVVRDLNGRTPAAFRGRAGRALHGDRGRSGDPGAPGPGGDVPRRRRGTTLDLGAAPAGAAPDASLDVSRLQDGVLAPLLGIADVRTDKRIDFVGGIRGTGELERLVDGGGFAVAFSLYPVSVDDLMRIADAGGIMPPKSTWFEPKLRDGVLSHLV